VTLCIPVIIFRDLVQTSLAAGAGEYITRADGDLLFPGHRPLQGRWHGHGYFPKTSWVLRARELVQITIWKHRWRMVGTSTTCHSRPDEEAPSAGACLLVIVLMVFSWLDSGRGLSHKDRREPIAGAREACASRRTVQRWLHKLLPYAMNTQQAIRRAVIERCEPRPVETLFEGDLSPPEGLERRPWKDPSSVCWLWRAFAILFRGALGLDVPVAILLAEARGRWGDPKIQKLFCPSSSPAPGR
jgi:hypothetical protein